MEGLVMQVGVIGGGFGYGLAMAVARGGHEVTLCTRRSFEKLAPRVSVTDSLSEALAHELVYLAVPSPSLEKILDELVHVVDGRHRLVHVSRGLIGAELQTLCQVLVQRTSARRVGVLAGPLSDAVLRDGNPGGGVVASDYPEVIRYVRETLGGPRLRIYGSADRQGVEVGAAMTGILLFALGFGAGMG
ncbi:MAG: NAD(P)-binding domain-containing protein, partial [Nannocystaceae bacterium]